MPGAKFVPPSTQKLMSDAPFNGPQCPVPMSSPSQASSSQETLLGTTCDRVERPMGDTEASYFLPSRGSGVNDMYLHLGCNAPPRLFDFERVRIIWALLRLRHPLLASKVEMHSYTDIRFVYQPPHSVENVLDDAASNMEYRTQTKKELLDAYLNGPRTLSQDCLSYLIVSDESKRATSDSSADIAANYDILICATHFLGDGMALHQFANDFFGLLGSSSTNYEFISTLSSEWQLRCGKFREQDPSLPAPLEERLPPVRGKFSQAVARINFRKNQDKLIGGHTFPRQFSDTRRTVTPVLSFDEKTTKIILNRCKSHGVSISSALFALCNIAWSMTSNQTPEMPMMMYSALNLRPYLRADPGLNDSYWYLAVGYFNVILPSFPSPSKNFDATFWHRARTAKKQCAHVAKSPMTVYRSREMALERGSRARAWAKEDDDKAAGTWRPPPPPHGPRKPVERPPSNALIGLSLLGNLDGIYKHPTFGDIRFHTLTTGSRQRAGGMLLFGYTFVGKLWISLGYDENAFKADTVQTFWKKLSDSIEELLVN